MSSRRRRSVESEEALDAQRVSKIARTEDAQQNAAPSKAAPDSLQTLLDTSNVEPDDLPQAFQKIAEALLLHHRLVVRKGEKKFCHEILEAEFYLVDAVRHPDPFTHGEEEQKVSGRWYFHRAPRWSKSAADHTPSEPGGRGYRGGSRKGVDLTFGNPYSSSTAQSSAAPSSADIRGGILLRTIRRVDTGQVVCGPSLLVDHILQHSGASDIKELVTTKWNNNSDAFADQSATSSSGVQLYIEPKNAAELGGKAVPKLYNSPRIGLELSNPQNRENRITFVDRHYRFFTNPKLFKDKGRAQTFVGLFRMLKTETNAKPPYKGLIRQRIDQILGIPDKVVEKFVTAYQAGWNGKGGQGVQSMLEYTDKGRCASPEGIVTMMGALDRYKVYLAVERIEAPAIAADGPSKGKEVDA